MDFLDYREKLGIGFCDNEKYKFFSRENTQYSWLKSH